MTPAGSPVRTWPLMVGSTWGGEFGRERCWELEFRLVLFRSMHGFTISLAQENARFGITVNTVSPGYIGTDMVMAVPEEVRNKIVAQIPTGRLGNPNEIAYAVSFFIPDDASWITGANLAANGGQYMGW